METLSRGKLKGFATTLGILSALRKDVNLNSAPFSHVLGERRCRESGGGDITKLRPLLVGGGGVGQM